MRCADFLDRFSDYRDGLLTPPEAEAFDHHVADCLKCARYRSVLERSVDVFRTLEPGMSAGARQRLDQRVAEIRARAAVVMDAGPVSSAAASVTILAVAAVFAIAAWAPVLLRQAETVLPAIVVADPPAKPLPGWSRSPALFTSFAPPSAPGRAGDLWSHSNALLYEYSVFAGRSGGSRAVRPAAGPQ